jgi:hypothetical protein
VALRSTPLSLQALQGDPTWNHVAFNARLLKEWLTGRPATIPAPEPWGSANPRKLDWTDVDLTGWAVPQPVLLRGLAADDPLRPLRPVCAVLLVAGLLLRRSRPGGDAPDADAREAAALSVLAPRPRRLFGHRRAQASSLEAAFDAIVRGLGFDSSIRLVQRPHRTGTPARSGAVVPDFLHARLPKDLPARVWDDTLHATFDLKPTSFLGEFTLRGLWRFRSTCHRRTTPSITGTTNSSATRTRRSTTRSSAASGQRIVEVDPALTKLAPAFATAAAEAPSSHRAPPAGVAAERRGRTRHPSDDGSGGR